MKSSHSGVSESIFTELNFSSSYSILHKNHKGDAILKDMKIFSSLKCYGPHLIFLILQKPERYVFTIEIQ